MLEMFDLPSNVESPMVSPALLIAHDWMRLFLPKSTDSKRVLLLVLVISTMPIFSLPRPAIKIGLAKSLQKTLLPISIVKTGWGFPGCQKCTLLSKAVDIITFCPGTM